VQKLDHISRSKRRGKLQIETTQDRNHLTISAQQHLIIGNIDNQQLMTRNLRQSQQHIQRLFAQRTMGRSI